MNSNDIGARIREAREAAGLSRLELSRESGVSATTLNRYERGERRPRIDDLSKTADALNVSLAWLAVGDENVKSPERAWIAVPHTRAYQCNRCNFTEWDAKRYKFCPECGARMANGGETE